jgi:hypothetical protein
MILTLTEQEYAALAEEAAKKGKKPETLLCERMREILQASPPKHRMSGKDFMEKLFLEGEIDNLPTREALSLEEQAERERLGRLFSGDKPMSEMVIEDRGPY